MGFLTSCPTSLAWWGWISVAQWGFGQMPKALQPGNGGPGHGQVQTVSFLIQKKKTKPPT